MVATRQFPGLVFRAETPLQAELPRMDIAAFVGFASRGPLHTPVPVEDVASFENLFGGTLRLAWDDETGAWQTACLAPAVRAFFAQGGRRCWIVRVAGPQAETNRFPLAGLLHSDAGGYKSVVAAARSPGSWSDSLQVRTGLQLETLQAGSTAIRPGSPFSLNLSPLAGQPVQAGDLLQLDCTDGRHRAYVALDPGQLQTGQRALQVTARPERTYWFRKVTADSQTSLSGLVQPAIPALSPGAAGTLQVESLILETSLAAAPGDWLWLDAGSERLWLLVAEARGETLLLSRAWFEGAQAGALSMARLLRLQLALQIAEESASPHTLANLGCLAPQPRFAGYLPDDSVLFDPGFNQGQSPLNNPAAALWAEVKQPRFPLSLALPEGSVVIPLGLEATPPWRTCLATTIEPQVRDGLVPPSADLYGLTGAIWADFMPQLFIDPALRTTGQASLLAEAHDRFYLQGQALTGLHALLPVDEVSLIALPDAAQRGWRLSEQQTVTPLSPPEPPPVPDPCAKDSPFAPKALEPEPEDLPDSDGDGALSAETEGARWQLVPSLEYDDRGLLAVQSAVAKLAAARADRVAVLGLPKHYRLPAALAHQQQLALELRRAGDTTGSYVALYHPWLVIREETGELLHVHPAGGVCGVMAARSLSRGAWVAPANEIMLHTLATVPTPASGDDQAYYSAGINPIRQGARGFVIWGGYTQSSDPDLEALNVRRLLILLRRLALVEGQTHVFAPHSPAFRRRVQQQFEQRLARLFALGAFAGREPAEAYRVVIDETVNTPASIEQGRLVVELRVAPSRPVTFIVVRLVQLDSGSLAVQEITGRGR